MQNPLLWILSVSLSVAGGYITGYVRKKGENRAIHEDFKKVLEQVKETTRATKEIEDKISDAAWDRQKRWELMRDILIDVATKSAAAKDALVALHSVYLPNNHDGENESVERMERQTKLCTAWNTAFNDLTRMVTIASLACGADVVTAVASFASFAGWLGAAIIDRKPDVFAENSEELATRYSAITKAMRKEIGNDSQPMFLPGIRLGPKESAPVVANPTTPLV